MKKKPQLNKKTIKNLKLKLKVNPLSDRKIAPMAVDMMICDRSNSMSCSFIHCY
jgi:predicted subunit of tRNA(5-methylaminomethyl-2-thiouridylate) methyltransferase